MDSDIDDDNQDDMDSSEEQYSQDTDIDYLLVNKVQSESHNRFCGQRIWCIKDICGYMCCVFMWLLISYAEYVVMFIILLPEQSNAYRISNVILFQVLTFLAIVSHLKTMFTDPGSVPKGNATNETIQKMGLREGQIIFKCQKCCCIKPERAHHCSVCQRCIRKMDHHCPWVNNCIGENNQKYFVLFTLYIATISLHAVTISIYRLIYCVSNEWNNCSVYSPPKILICILILMICAFIFGTFTIVMLVKQLVAICHDKTGIERLKKEQARWEKKTRWKNLQVVFGPVSVTWLSPFHGPNCKNKSCMDFYSV